MKYIFGDYKGRDFYFKKTSQGWKGNSGDVEFLENAEFPSEYTVNDVKGILIRKLHEAVNFSNPRKLQEARAPEQLKAALKTVLGCLSTTNGKNVEDLFTSAEDSSQQLTAETRTKLEDIASGKEKVRTLETQYPRKAWITLRGVYKDFRKLASQQNAYLFAFLNNGDILESVSSKTVLKYHVDLQGLNAEEIHARFEKAIEDIKDVGLMNNFKISAKNSKASGELVAITLEKIENVEKINSIQKTFRDVFTSEEPAKTGVKGLLKKATQLIANKFRDAFEKVVDNKVELSDYTFQGVQEVKMYYSQEEVDLAKEILQEFPEKTETPTVKKPSFSNTSLGNRLRKSATLKLSDYPAAKKAAANLRKNGWNQEDAKTLLKAATAAIQNSSWKDAKKLGDVLRQTGLIEKSNQRKNKECFKEFNVLGGKLFAIEVKAYDGRWAIVNKSGNLSGGEPKTFKSEAAAKESDIFQKLVARGKKEGVDFRIIDSSSMKK